MDTPKILSRYVLPTIVAAMVGAWGYVINSQTENQNNITKLYHPFEAEYFDIMSRDTSSETDKLNPELLELQAKASEFRRMQSRLPAPAPDKETKTLERLTLLWEYQRQKMQ